MTTYWWVNHNQTFSQEVGGSYLWSPVAQRDGKRSEFYENMKRIQQGDIVFSYAGGLVQAAGVCTGPAVLMPKPHEFGASGAAWRGEGWRVPVQFHRLAMPIRPKDHMHLIAPTLPAKYSPIRSDGVGNQGAYLAAVPEAMASTVIALVGSQWAALSVELAGVQSNTEGIEREVERAIQNRTDIGDTEKMQLVRARRGQGVYRQNLESFEQACRVTGVTESVPSSRKPHQAMATIFRFREARWQQRAAAKSARRPPFRPRVY